MANPNAVFSALKTKLTGLSTAVATAVTESDNILQAVGKLQGQVTNNAALLPQKIGGTWYKSGMWYPSFWPFTTTVTTLSPNVGVQYFIRFTAAENKTFSNIGISCTLAGISGDAIQIGLYASDANNNPTGLPIFVSSNLPVNTTGTKSATCSLAVTAGTTYWLSFVLLGTKQAAFRAANYLPVSFDGCSSPDDTLLMQVKYLTGVTNMASVNASSATLDNAISPIPNILLRAA